MRINNKSWNKVFSKQSAMATILLMALILSVSSPALMPSSTVSERLITTMPEKEDIFKGRFSSKDISLAPNQVVDGSFSICPTMDVTHTVIRFIMPADLVKLVKGKSVSIGDVEKGEIVNLEFSIGVEEAVDAYVRVDVDAFASETRYSSSYYLHVTSPSNLLTDTECPNECLVTPRQKFSSPSVDQQIPKSPGKITINATFWYIDEYGNFAPMRQVVVKLMDADEPWPWPDDEVASKYTDYNGFVSFRVDNNDGLGEGGRDPYLKVYSDGGAAYCGPSAIELYVMKLPKAGTNVPDGFNYDYGTWYPSSKNEAWQAIDAALTERDWIYWRSSPNWQRSTKVRIEWPSGDWPSYNPNLDYIILPEKSVWPWNHIAVHHEYAHSVMKTLYGIMPLGWGPSPHYPYSESSEGFALVEGWAEFMQCAVDDDATNSGSYWYRGHGGNIENNDWYECIDTGDMDGNIVEGSVASILWDINDPTNTTDKDDMYWGFEEIFTVIRYDRPNNIDEFWDKWKNRWSDLASSKGPLSTIYWHYGIDKDYYAPHEGSVSINGGDTYTTSTSVTLAVSASDYGSGVAYVRFSNDNIYWSGWYGYGASYLWTLSSGDGTKTVYVQFRDLKNYTSSTYSDSIILDTVAPIGSIVIGSGNPTYTKTASITLYLTYSDTTSGARRVRYSNDGIWDTEPWETPGTTKGWTLTSGDGTKTVYYQIEDWAGLLSTTYSDTIILDTTPPTGSISIVGDSYTTSTSVILILAYSDTGSGVDKVRYSNDNVWDTEPWENPTTIRAWTLTTGDAAKVVSYQIRDMVGWLSLTHSDAIVLDTHPPTGSIIINSDATYTTSVSVTLTLTYSDATSGVHTVRYSNDNVWDTEPWENPSVTKTWTLPLADGAKFVNYQIRDYAGLLSTTYSDTIILDTTAPTGSIVIGSGNPTYTTTTIVILYLTYSDATSGVDKVRYSNDGSSWTGWETPTASRAWILTWGDGTKTVYYQIRDNAGWISITYTDTIILDMLAPTGSIVINSGNPTYTTSTSVTLYLTYFDAASGVDKVRYSDDGVWDTEPWETPAATKAWTLTSGDGTKTVYYQIKDNADRLSVTYSDQISLDTTPPVTTISHSPGSSIVSLSATDATSGVQATYYHLDSDPWTKYTGSFTLPGTGSHVIWYYSQDNAGNNEAIKTLKVHYLTVDTDPAGITTISGTGWYDYGTTATTGTAPKTVASGYTTYAFAVWKKDGTLVGGNPISILMDAPHTATAAYIYFKIWTDKATYKIGETMKVYVRVRNPGAALPVKAKIFLKLPSGVLYGPLLDMTTTIPAGYDSGNVLWKTFTIPSAPLGSYAWIAELRDEYEALICHSIWNWQLLASLSTETPSVSAILQTKPE